MYSVHLDTLPGHNNFTLPVRPLVAGFADQGGPVIGGVHLLCRLVSQINT